MHSPVPACLILRWCAGREVQRPQSSHLLGNDLDMPHASPGASAHIQLPHCRQHTQPPESLFDVNVMGSSAPQKVLSAYTASESALCIHCQATATHYMVARWQHSPTRALLRAMTRKRAADGHSWPQQQPVRQSDSSRAMQCIHGRRQLTQDAKGIYICTPCEAALRQQLWRHVGHSAIGFGGNAGGASKNTAETKI